MIATCQRETRRENKKDWDILVTNMINLREWDILVINVSTVQLEQILWEHILNEHKEVRYLCDECEFAATTADILRKHIENIHNGLRYPCDECEFALTTNIFSRRFPPLTIYSTATIFFRPFAPLMLFIRRFAPLKPTAALLTSYLTINDWRLMFF